MEYFVDEMRRTGIRRICVLSGSNPFLLAQFQSWQAACSGDWLQVNGAPSAIFSGITGGRVKQLLGQEVLHAAYDATTGFDAEALAVVAGTLMAGSWLLLLTPPPAEWSQFIDRDSLRWADSDSAISAPVFMQHLAQQLMADPDVIWWQEGGTAPSLKPAEYPLWCADEQNEQQQVLDQLRMMTRGTAVVTAARGRGKSALGGMLAAEQPSCLVSAPAKVSTEVLAQFAGKHYQFMAPDAIVGAESLSDWQWLIVDEAAAIPAPILQAMIARFPRSLLLTTTDGYEGTGRGFLLKFCANLTEVQLFSLTHPRRYRDNDPLERFINAVTLLSPPPSPAMSSLTEAVKFRCYHSSDWQWFPKLAYSTYYLLQAAHYRTTPLDLRRMMDAPEVGYLQAVQAEQCVAALGWGNEGGLDASLAEAVWRGERRPRGNLVAQSLAAHSRFPEAMLLKSRRISRIVVIETLRRRGLGRQLIEQLILQAADKDFISVSFGLTAELLTFWQQCGFHLVRIGTQREASSGCYAAMALYPLSIAGQALCEQASEHFAREWYWQASQFAPECEVMIASSSQQEYCATDRHELEGFAYAHRALATSYPALQRAWTLCSERKRLPYLAHYLSQGIPPSDMSKKNWLVQLRKETQCLLEILS